MDFYGDIDFEIKIINILINALQNKKNFEQKMMVLEESMHILRYVFDKEPEKVMLLFKELLELI